MRGAPAGCGAGVDRDGTAAWGLVWCGATVGGGPGARARWDGSEGGGVPAAVGRAGGCGLGAGRWALGGEAKGTDHDGSGCCEVAASAAARTGSRAQLAGAGSAPPPDRRTVAPTARGPWRVVHGARHARRVARCVEQRGARSSVPIEGGLTASPLRLPAALRSAARHAAGRTFRHTIPPRAFPQPTRALPCSPSGCSAVW